jgi:hypothetical protein
MKTETTPTHFEIIERDARPTCVTISKNGHHQFDIKNANKEHFKGFMADLAKRYPTSEGYRIDVTWTYSYSYNETYQAPSY